MQFGGMTREKALSMFANLPWTEYVHARAFLTQQEVNVLQRTEEASLDFAIEDSETARHLVFVLQKVVALINDVSAQHYALTRIDDILSGNCDIERGAESIGLKELQRRAKLFQDAKGCVDVPLFMHILRMDGPDAYSKSAAALSLARLLVSSTSPVEPLISWICDELAKGLSSASSEVMATAVRALTIILKRQEARVLFAEHGGIGYLTKLLKSSKSGGSGSNGVGGGGGAPNAQLLYELTFSMWTLSFNVETRPLFIAAGSLPVLVDQITAAPREKVVRVSLATVRNLVAEDETQEDNRVGNSITNTLIGCGLPKSLANLKDRAWADPDVANDVEEVYESLMANYRELSTFDRWINEVNSKHLKWGSKLIHCEKFWRENAKELEKHDFKLLKELIQLLASLEDEVVAVACYDLGEFVRFYPNGKSLVKNLGGKDMVMKLIEAENPEVQREALQCMSKIMVNQWEFLR
jgi:V-type H+-transporting ATPase subunit H